MNPTRSDIIVNAPTVRAGHLARLTISDAGTDLANFVSQGCVAAPASKTNGTANITDTINDLATLIQRGAQLLDQTAQAAVSAAGDPFGSKGI